MIVPALRRPKRELDRRGEEADERHHDDHPGGVVREAPDHLGRERAHDSDRRRARRGDEPRGPARERRDDPSATAPSSPARAPAAGAGERAVDSHAEGERGGQRDERGGHAAPDVTRDVRMRRGCRGERRSGRCHLDDEHSKGETATICGRFSRLRHTMRSACTAAHGLHRDEVRPPRATGLRALALSVGRRAVGAVGHALAEHDGLVRRALRDGAQSPFASIAWPAGQPVHLPPFAGQGCRRGSWACTCRAPTGSARTAGSREQPLARPSPDPRDSPCTCPRSRAEGAVGQLGMHLPSTTDWFGAHCGMARHAPSRPSPDPRDSPCTCPRSRAEGCRRGSWACTCRARRTGSARTAGWREQPLRVHRLTRGTARALAPVRGRRAAVGAVGHALAEHDGLVRRALRDGATAAPWRRSPGPRDSPRTCPGRRAGCHPGTASSRRHRPTAQPTRGRL